MRKIKIIFWLFCIGCITMLGCSTISRISLKGTKNMKGSFAKAALKGRYAGKIFRTTKYFSRLGFNGTKEAIKTMTKRPSIKLLQTVKISSIKFPKLVLQDATQFRKVASYECQFVKNARFSDEILKSQILGEEGKAGILYKNMLKLGMTDEIWQHESQLKAFYKEACIKRSATHHIVPVKNEKCRKILQKYKIDINDGRNGIILPMDKLNYAKGSLHGSNTKEYEEFIYKQIKNCKSQKAIFAKIDEIKEGLYNGEIKILTSSRHELIN